MINNSKNSLLKLKPIVIMSLLAQGSISLAFANVTPVSVNTSVINNPSGAEIVNISKANNYGVSVNHYDKFDVGANGVILNNSNASTNTVLAGQIQGNQNMTRGPADIIVNQVWSGNKISNLNGMIEVAGQKAHVVIANAAGITCNGCGFINASRATLTTTDSLAYYDPLYRHTINGGKVIIEGRGLKAADADFTDIIAQSVKIDAAVHAKDLRVTTGNNVVSRDNDYVYRNGFRQPNDNSSITGIDVSRLGGMYADKITLIGSGTGVGVKNAGTLFSEGDIQITNAGAVINRGQFKSQGEIFYQTADASFDNSKGVINAAGGISGVSKSLNNTQGKIISSDIQLGTAQEGLINERGLIKSSGMITINAESLDNRAGKIISEKDNYLYVGEVDNREGMILSRSGTTHIFANTIKSSHSGGISGVNLNINGKEIYDGAEPATPSNSNKEVIDEALASVVVKENDYAGEYIDWNAVNEGVASVTVVESKNMRSHIDQDAVNNAIASVKTSDDFFAPVGSNKPGADAGVDYEIIEGVDDALPDNILSSPHGVTLPFSGKTKPFVETIRFNNPDKIAFSHFAHKIQ